MDDYRKAVGGLLLDAGAAASIAAANSAFQGYLASRCGPGEVFKEYHAENSLRQVFAQRPSPFSLDLFHRKKEASFRSVLLFAEGLS